MQVSLIAALTADGFIARDADQRSFDWTSEEDKRFYVDFIKKSGVVIMGAKSFATFNRYPKGLTYVIYTRRPEEFINPRPEIITTIATKDEPKEILNQLAQKGLTKVAICGGASIYTMFLKSGLVNKLYLTYEPILFGSGVKLLNEALDLKLKLIQTINLSAQTRVVEYET